jgi:2-methylisocitrate lyase-like PEP mutase family enzyme
MSHQAETFRRLHDPGRLLVLANVWDAASAALFQSLGAEALATSSASLCWAHGYADGGAFPRATLLRSLEEIARVVRVPLTVDSEAGYSDDPKQVAALVAEIAKAGGVGINLEDGTSAPELLAAKIEAVKSAVPDVFVNARVDVYLKRLVPAERAADEALARVERYQKAGCDGVFVPALAKPDAIRAVVAATPLPLNLLAVPGLAPVAELRALGVRRLSVGGLTALAALGAAKRAVHQLLTEGRFDALFEGAPTHGELNALFTTPDA